jgi:hypothetical protein
MNCVGAMGHRQKSGQKAPLRPFRGEREGPTPEAWEGEVGGATARLIQTDAA